MKLFYRESGEGRPLVVLHGLFGSSDNWMSVAKELALTNKLYVLDARNHGQSPHDDEFNYTVMADDLKEFLEEHQIIDPVLIGHSMGGKTVMRFAVKFPDIASRLIIVDISPRFYGRHHDTILDGLNSIDLTSLKTRGEADEILAKYVGDIGVRQFLLKSLYRDSEGRFQWRINLSIIQEKIENVGEALPPGTTISIPTLFIKGSESGYIEEKDVKMIEEHFTDYRIQTVEGASHFVHAEKPIEVINLIRTFIGE